VRDWRGEGLELGAGDRLPMFEAVQFGGEPIAVTRARAADLIA